jgi:excinuclease ABC subunit A
LPIEIKGAKEHNLDINELIINDGLTVVTGVSGSGKSSLVFNTIYHEANRQFHDAFGLSSKSKFTPADVDEIIGLRPAIAIDQNVLNRNPNSTLATASGLHPLFRILFSRFGKRKCLSCGQEIQNFNKDEIIQLILEKSRKSQTEIIIPIIKNLVGKFDTLIDFLQLAFPQNKISIETDSDNKEQNLQNTLTSIFLHFNVDETKSISEIREIIDTIEQLGFQTAIIEFKSYNWGNCCSDCGTWLSPVEPKLFHTFCPNCKGINCFYCNYTGYHPQSLGITWKKITFLELLKLNVLKSFSLFSSSSENEISIRLMNEILKRHKSLLSVGLDYLELNRSMPSLSRGESQRVRLALALINNLEDIIYILDEPSVGLHIKNVMDLLPELRKLKGTAIFVEHDKIAAASADYAIDIGPGAGKNGGKVVFSGTPLELWHSQTTTGKYFSNTIKTEISKTIRDSKEFLELERCYLRNLKGFNLKIPFQQLIVVTGVSGSGKTTLVVDVLVASLLEKKAIGCNRVSLFTKKVILIDQSPIGKNPRSNPATYTKLADLLRESFAKKTNLDASYFSFNHKDGACTECKGLGSIEVKMNFLPSTWITCEVCQGKKFNNNVLEARISLNGNELNFDDILSLNIETASELLLTSDFFDNKQKKIAKNIFNVLIEIGLGYLQLGQASPTLSGGESQRIKLTKYLGKSNISDCVLVLDEPSTGLHPADISGLLSIFNRLLNQGATIIVVEHNADIIKSADWIIDLGPGSGDYGGELLYNGNLEGLLSASQSITAKMLHIEKTITPNENMSNQRPDSKANYISIRHARANNLQDVSVKFPKNAICIITGISGSGKSSIVNDTIEVEARRRFLESLSMYERQSVHEGAEAEAEIEGLGVTFSLQAKKERYYLRNTVGFATDLTQQFAIIYAQLGVQYCDTCQIEMVKQNNEWRCLKCNKKYKKSLPKHFSPRNYSSACYSCHGIGTKSIPNPNKLIINTEKSICGGAMYSPGFFPKGYLCKEGNGGYYWLRALGKLFDFDPEETPWNDISEEAKNAFLFGSEDELEFKSFGLTGNSHSVKQKNKGFYGFIQNWDVGGTYTDHIPCPTCNGGGLKAQYLNIIINGLNFRNIHQLSLYELLDFVKSIYQYNENVKFIEITFKKIINRLTFLTTVGLKYLNLQRPMGTLSAGEAQRIKLASLIGSSLQGLTITLDEPTRGMHPSEVQSLIRVLKDLKQKNNTLLVIEHDLDVIKSGDFIIELGPSSGKKGGKIINYGPLNEFCNKNSLTAQWILHNQKVSFERVQKKPNRYLKLFGARENNLKGDTIEIPLGLLVGVCGVSGSGKSTLIIDTLGRIIAPQKQTTSVAMEPIKPGIYDSIEGSPPKAIIIDQVIKGISNPLTFFELDKILIEIYKDCDDFIQSELNESIFMEKCSNCKGEGLLKSDMGFLPSLISECDICSGTGLIQEVWTIKYHGLALPELYSLTMDEINEIFIEEKKLIGKIKIIINLGLGYLQLKQPSHTLSGGEVQRLKIAKELMKKSPQESFFLFDEPSLGLHMEDISQLLRVLRTIVDQNNTVIIIEHQPYILASCDWLIELGPEGGEKGGFVINTGHPKEFVKKETPTSIYIKEIIE